METKVLEKIEQKQDGDWKTGPGETVETPKAGNYSYDSKAIEQPAKETKSKGNEIQRI